jgi:epoxyqueuosine reductase
MRRRRRTAATCTRCIDACPTEAIIPGQGGFHTLHLILTIELRGHSRSTTLFRGAHVFGCDICQTSSLNRHAATTTAITRMRPAPRHFAAARTLAAITEQEFHSMFGGTPVTGRISKFLRNVAVAMGNLRRHQRRSAGRVPDPVVAEHARWALEQIPWPEQLP